MKSLKRVKKMVESDRLGLCFGQEDLIKRDIERVLCEYFNLSKPIEIRLIPMGEKISIEILGECVSVKRINFLG